MSNKSITQENIDAIDIALDRCYATGIPKGVRASTLATEIGWTRDDISPVLQQYLKAQSKGRTRHVIGCRGYGLGARWYILAKPGADTVTLQKARSQQGIWITEDALTRYITDQVREVNPGVLRHNAVADQKIRDTVADCSAHFQVSVNTLIRELSKI